MSRTLAVVLWCWACAATASAQSVDEIVARNAAARGGAERWRAVQTMKASGRMEIGKGMQVPFRLELKRPRKMRLEFEFAGTTAVQVFDGVTGSKLMPFLGRTEAIPLSDKELEGAAGPLELDGPLIDYRRKGHALALLGREAIEGTDAFKLALKPAQGAERTIYVDVASGLELMVESPYTVRGREAVLRTHFRDYRSVDGLLVPGVVESRVAGAAQSHKLTVDAVQLGLPIDDARFASPAASPAVSADGRR